MAKGKIAITLGFMLTCAAAWADVVPAARAAHFGPAAPFAVAVGVVEPAAAQAATAAAPVPGDSRLCDINWLLGSTTGGPNGIGQSSLCGTGQWPVQSAPSVLPGDLAGGPSRTVTDLPPAPSSLALVLSALASFGAYQGVRSLKRLHLGALPDWYHADAVQVGHATPLRLEFDCSALPVCAFEQPSALRPHISYRISCEPSSRLRSQFLLLIEAPRAPPPPCAA
ncbi:MAG: hypothetical protein AB1601_16885 [Planctomycetota bacterium]